VTEDLNALNFCCRVSHGTHSRIGACVGNVGVEVRPADGSCRSVTMITAAKVERLKEKRSRSGDAFAGHASRQPADQAKPWAVRARRAPDSAITATRSTPAEIRSWTAGWMPTSATPEAID
jgi:hypothetical protein